MTLILKAAPLVAKRTELLKSECRELVESGVTPFLKVVLVGDDPGSVIYTQSKKRFVEKVGAKGEIVKLDANTSEKDFLKVISEINKDDSVHGCLIQLPLPKQLSHIDVKTLVTSKKDVDGFHPENVAKLYYGSVEQKNLVPCTPKGIITLLEHYDIDISGKNAAVIGRSTIVGKPMSMLLSNHDATVTLCHSKTKDLSTITKSADIIVVAIGIKKFLTKEFLNPEGSQIIIDVGINRLDDKRICGDSDYKNIIDDVAAITPVPGGVGPMTILSLIENLFTATKNQLEK